MHAAMAVLPACISLFVFRSRMLKFLSVFLSAIVCLSIMTAKEHWAIDVPAGIVLGLAASWVWKHRVWGVRDGTATESAEASKTSNTARQQS
jgi:membrane-associated phospholipid phosphatase